MDTIKLAGDAETPTPSVDTAALTADAERLVDADDLAGARALLERGLHDCRATADTKSELALLQALLALERRGQRHGAALTLADRIAACCRKLGDRAGEADALLTVGDAARALDRLPKAQQAYTAAGVLFEALGDGLGRADLEYRLGLLAATRDRERAAAHFRRAAAGYLEIEQTRGGGALRISNPHLPDSGEDSRLVEPWIMIKVAERELASVEACPQPVVAPARQPDAPVEPEPPRTPPPTRRELMVAAAVLGGIAAGFVVLMVVVRVIPSVPVSIAHVMSALIGLGAAVIAWVLTARQGVRAPSVLYGGPAVAGVMVFAMSAWLVPTDASQATAVPPASVADAGAAPAPEGEPTAPAVLGRTAAEQEEIERQRFTRALKNAAALGDRLGQADVLRQHAAFEHAVGDPDRALTLYEQSDALYRSAAAPTSAAEVALAMGDVLTAAGRLTAASERYQAAWALYRDVTDSAGQLRSLRKLGALAARRHQWATAEEIDRQALVLARALPDRVAEQRLLIRLGTAARARGDAEQARIRYAEALGVAREAQDRAGQARAWLATADLESALGQDDAADAGYAQAIALAEGTGDARLGARIRRHRGGHAMGRGRLEAARADYELALRLAEAGQARAQQALARIALAALATRGGTAPDARRHLEGALALYGELGQPARRAEVLLALGDLDLARGERDAARRAFADALDLVERTDDDAARLAVLDRLQQLLASTDPAQAATYRQRAAAVRDAAAPAPREAGDNPTAPIRSP